ncbi:ATP-binding protein [Candidatus Venteria ishoeyi]|uniref:AAA family ATPase n=1 Tax=Candidatus Venteria ishoeyi TaxID=1899563 RepID=UPI0025A4D561|nr:ATP-binding protein [Candidatus Venteria ishoeyi]MDM8547320.1 ATP-binding protein [Candidatus Venteria ishoeyi]
MLSETTTIEKAYLYLEDFKGFSARASEWISFNLSQPLTTLIGPNGSGKSNLIEALELLDFLAHGGALHETSDLGRNSRMEIRGGLQACTTYGKTEFRLGFKAEIKFEGKLQRVFYELAINTEKTPEIIRECLMAGDDWIFINDESDLHTRTVSYKNFKPGQDPSVQASLQQSLLFQYKTFATHMKPEKKQTCEKLIDNITDYFSSFVFDPEPKLMRQYAHLDASPLTKNAANISAILFTLSKGNKTQRQSLEHLLSWINQLPGTPYQDFHFTVTDYNDSMFALIEQNGNKTTARTLSDGTLRCLALLTKLETAHPGSRIIMDEFDNGLHPSRINMLVSAIDDCCQRRNLKLIVTTHNPATLNALSTDQLNGVVLCYQNLEDNGTQLIALSQFPYQQEMLERGALGDLVTHQIVDQYLAPNFEKKRQQKAMKWLEDF